MYFKVRGLSKSVAFCSTSQWRARCSTISEICFSKKSVTKICHWLWCKIFFQRSQCQSQSQSPKPNLGGPPGAPGPRPPQIGFGLWHWLLWKKIFHQSQWQILSLTSFGDCYWLLWKKSCTDRSKKSVTTDADFAERPLLERPARMNQQDCKNIHARLQIKEQVSVSHNPGLSVK